MKTRKSKHRAIFLDRDGVINYEKNFVLSPEDMELIPQASEAISKINQSDYLSIVVTNQSAIARNLISIRELENIHNKLTSDLNKNNAYLDAIYYCPHHPNYAGPEANKNFIQECSCRKPHPGMLLDASNDFSIDLKRSFFIGDSDRDIIAGREAGCTTIGVRTGKNIENFNVHPDYIFDHVLGAVNFILGDSNTPC